MKYPLLYLVLCWFASWANQTWAGAGAVQAASSARLESWARLTGEVISLSDAQKVDAVNRFINQTTKYISDAEQYGQEEYWANPTETVMNGAGDCEDYAIAKFFTLLTLGVPADKLRLAYSLIEDGRRHMVLIYLPDQPEGVVLDNLTNQMIALGDRDDLKVVFSFDEQWLYLGASSKPLRKSNSLARWAGVQQQLVAFTF